MVEEKEYGIDGSIGVFWGMPSLNGNPRSGSPRLWTPGSSGIDPKAECISKMWSGTAPWRWPWNLAGSWGCEFDIMEGGCCGREAW
jgi:hypothetical protein